MDIGEIRQKIAALELMADAQSAIADVESVEWEDGEERTLKLGIIANGQAVDFVFGVPPEAMVRALRALQGDAA